MASSPPPLDADLPGLVLKTAPAVVYVYDLKKEASAFQNRRFGELLGHPSQTGPGPNDWHAHIHPDDKQRFPAHRERLRTIAPGETLLWEFRMRDAGGEWRWFLSRDALLSSDGAGEPHLVVGSAFEITEQKRAEEHKELLADEMRHRARNLVSLVQAIGRMSRPKDQPEVNKYLDVFMGRLLTILNTGGIVLSSSERTADLGVIVDATLKPFRDADAPSRIATQGPSVILNEHTAGGMALAIHELATNAIKYGALSVETGSVSVTWRIDDGRFWMEWRETGGPAAKTPSAEGFGGLVIRQSIARERDHKITLDYLPEGLRCRFEFALAARG